MGQISLCVIARDEESFLPGLLESVRGGVDQIVVVDTGSTDQTVAIAKAAGAVVTEHPWQDDFAMARNAALEHATGDWILVLDCDERLSSGAVEAIRDAVAADNFDLGMLPLHNAKSVKSDLVAVLSGEERIGEPVWLPRLYRRTGDLIWEGAVHESVSSWIAAEKRLIRRLNAPIVHYGYAPAELAYRKKDERNLRLLEKRCAAEPNNPHIRTHLAQAYLQAGKASQAIEAIEQAWTSMARSRQQGGVQPAVVSLATLRAYVQLRTDEVEGAQETLEQARKWGADHANIDVLSGVCHETFALKQMGVQRKESLTQAKTYFQNALNKQQKVAFEERMPGATSWASQTRLATVHLMLGELEEASSFFSEAIESKPDHLEAHLGLAEAVLFGGNPELALELVEPYRRNGSPDAWVISACAADVLADTVEMRTYTEQALTLQATAFVSPHRRIQLQALACAASIYDGVPQSGPGTLGVIGALMGRHPMDESTLVVSPANPSGIESLVRNVIQAGQSELLDSLFSRRAESLIPGVGEMVRDAVAKMGGSVEDDGESEYLFIGGAGRSGTTLLRTMLDAHKNISVGPERKVVRQICGLREEWQRNAAVFDQAGVPQEVLDEAVKAFVSTLMDATGGGAPRVGEKTPPNLVHMDILGRLFPQARFIHVIRDGRAVSASLLKQNWQDLTTGEKLEFSIERAAQYWAAMVQEIRAKASSVPGRYLEVRYEDLVLHPKATMQRVLAFLDEPWDEAVLEHEKYGAQLPETESSSTQVSKPIYTDAISRWESELSDGDRGVVETLAGPVLRELGYAA